MERETWSDAEEEVLIEYKQMRGERGRVMLADRYIGLPSALHI